MSYVIRSAEDDGSEPRTLTADELARFVRGEAAYFADIVKRYDATLHAITSRFRLTSAEAEDVIQDAWVRAYMSRGDFRNGGAFGGWLGRVCRNLCLDTIRLRRRQNRTLCDVSCLANVASKVIDDRSAIDAGFRALQFADWIDDQVVLLPPKQRQVAALRWLLGWSVARIAAHVGRSTGTVKAELFHARQRVRRALLTSNSAHASKG